MTEGGPRIRFVGQTASTNADVRALALAGAPHGEAVVAGSQTQGRGRLGRAWLSPPGNVYLSVLLRPRLPAARVPLLCLMAAAVVAERCGPGFRIKWPNDVLGPDGRKVAGILAEAESSGGRPSYVVLGVGINVATRPDLPTAGVLGHGDPEVLAAAVVRGLVEGCEAVERDPAAVLDRWRRNAELGARVQVAGLEGVAVDVDEAGALLLIDDRGVRHRVLAGEVHMVGPPLASGRA